MCEECGCGQKGPYRIDGQPVGEVTLPLAQAETIQGSRNPAASPPQASPDSVSPRPAGAARVELHEPVLALNDRFAERNRGAFQALGLTVLNLVSSPGAGKTTLLQATLAALQGRLRAGVIVGDLATENDATRLRQTDAPVIQITTGTLCHLEAEMVANALRQLDLRLLDLLFIENVGNLVCPASFDLGEGVRVALLSTPEGEDKPLKYPPIFQNADAVVLTKLDLADAVGFDRTRALENVRRASPKAKIFETAATTGDGVGAWCDFLAQLCEGSSGISDITR
jgi:hydrogenase nickel incorporation protein HypB